MTNPINRISLPNHWIYSIFSLALIFALLAMPLQRMLTLAQSNDPAVSQDDKGQASVFEKDIPGKRLADTNELDIVNGYDFGTSKGTGPGARPEAIGTDQGRESEPNNTFATADVLTGTDGRIKGSIFSGTTTPAATDPDWYSFTTTVANSKIYAAIINSPSSTSDTLLAVFAGDGTTQLEIDDDDGSFGGFASTIAGTTLATPGTYYLRVTNFSTATPISVYDLYFAVRSGPTTAETEPNNNGTPQALPASQYVNGAIDPVGDTDTFTFAANAGDTVYLSQDLDPERDTVTFDGRIGIGILGTPGSFLVTSDPGTDDLIDSEAIVMTVKTTGTYQVYVDAQVAGVGGPAATYAFSVTTIPAVPSGTCTTYSNLVPVPIPDMALTSSSITIPDSKIIRSLRVVTDITHPNYPDLDVHLRSPANNDNGLFTDVGSATQTGPQNLRFDDEAGLPLLGFGILNGPIWRPEPAYRLNWFNGENSLGTWTLDIRDDSSAVTTPGTLNGWSLEVCEESALTGTLIYDENFEANNGGYTLGPANVQNEWEWGTPATAAQTVTAPFIAPFLNCASGTNCWKTDLDNTYNISSSQDLTSPPINLTQSSGTLRFYWHQRYQMENTSFDRIWVRVTNVNNPAETRMLWHADNQTMSETIGAGQSLANTPESAGWGRYSADISDFAGDIIQVTFHLESDNLGNYGGWAIDDVSIRQMPPTAATVSISGRVIDASGRGIRNATLVLEGGPLLEPRSIATGAFGTYGFDGLQVGTYTLTVNTKRYSFTVPSRVINVVDDITGFDFVAEAQE